MHEKTQKYTTDNRLAKWSDRDIDSFPCVKKNSE